MSNDIFSTELPDLNSFIKELDLLDENVNEAVRESMHEGADIILAEQRRLADATGVLFLAKSINKGKLYSVKKGSLNITTGYQTDAFNYKDTDRKSYRKNRRVSRSGIVHDGDYWMYADKSHAGIIGLLYEFGRPGKSRMRSGSQMKQIRLRIPNKGQKRKYWLKAVPTEVEIEKGKISPRPHIRRGFDNKIGEAVDKTIEALERETGKVFNE